MHTSNPNPFPSQLHQGEGGATIQTVQSLTDVNGHENMTVDLTETQDGQIFITTEDGQGEDPEYKSLFCKDGKLILIQITISGYPVSVSNVISVPVSMYQSVMANMQQITNSDGTVCLAPMQVDTSATRSSSTTTGGGGGGNANFAGLQCYSLISAGAAVGRRGGGATLMGQPATLQAAPGGRYYLAATATSSTTSAASVNVGNVGSGSSFGGHQNNNNSALANNNNSIKMPLPIVLATPSVGQVASTRSTRRGGNPNEVALRRRKPPGSGGGGSSLKPKSTKSMEVTTTSTSSNCSSSAIRCVDSASLTNFHLQLPAKTIKLEHLE